MRLLRMDRSGHTELAAWTAGDPAPTSRPRRSSGSRSTAATWGWPSFTTSPSSRSRSCPWTSSSCCCAAPSSAASGFRTSGASGRSLAAARRRARAAFCASASRPHTWRSRWRRCWWSRSCSFWFQPLLLPVSLLALAHAWVIPELFANRGAGVVRVPRGGTGAEMPSRSRRGCSGTCSPTSRASCSAAPGSRSSTAAWACGWSAMRARCWSGRAAAGCTPTACRRRTRSCRARTASRTCCWPCARTSWASRPSQTTLRRGHLADAAPDPAVRRPALDAAVRQRPRALAVRASRSRIGLAAQRRGTGALAQDLHSPASS